MTPLARLLRADVRLAQADAPLHEPKESPEDAHARGLAEGLLMVEHALAGARAEAEAGRAAMQAEMQAAMQAALDALADAFATELGSLAHAMVAQMLEKVPEAAGQALEAMVADLAGAGLAGAELRAHPGSVAALEPLCAGAGLTITADPALSAGMMAARTASGERVDGVAMRLDRMASAVVEPPE